MNTRVEIICGPMFAGKTSEGIRRGSTIADIKNGKCLYITHCMDDRPDITNNIGVSSHSELNMNLSPNRFLCIKTNDLIDTFDKVYSNKENNIVSIVLDEAQFFIPSDIKWLINIVITTNLVNHIYICGLDGNGYLEPFNNWISVILPFCEKIRKINAFCMHKMDCGNICNANAYFTKRRPDAPEGNVGGAERWMAVCKHHI